MTTRALGGSAAGMTGSFPSSATIRPSGGAGRPNFLFLVPDQLRTDALGCFGSPLAVTPHIDDLAASGTVFTEAYVQHPVCSPSRASFLTGWYPHVRGHRSLTHLLRRDEPNLLRILKDSGYHVTFAGARGDTFAPGVTELSVHEYGFTEALEADRGHGRAWPSDAWARVFYRGRLPVDASGRVDVDEATTRTALHRLEVPAPEPWALFVAFVAPHCPFEVAEPWYSMVDRDAVPDPAPPAEGREPAFKAAVRRRYGLDRISPAMWREVAATYHGMVARLDHQVGRILAGLADAGGGQAERTITFFFSDHGEYLGDFGLIEKWPSAMDRCITSDPLVVAGAGLPAGGRCPAMTELVDVLPTVLELAGIPAPHPHFGRSLVPVLHDPSRPHRALAFTEGGFSEWEEPQFERPAFPYDLKGALQHEQPRLVGRSVAVRDERWTYVWRLYEGPELYDRREDPRETVNVAGRSDVAGVELHLERELLQWLVDTADVIPRDEDPRFPEVDLPAPPRAGR